MPSEQLFYSRMKSRVELSFPGLFELFLILVGTLIWSGPLGVCVRRLFIGVSQKRPTIPAGEDRSAHPHSATRLA